MRPAENDLEEMAAVVPILQRIVTDTSVINPVRARAQRMIERAGSAKAMIRLGRDFPSLASFVDNQGA